MDIARAQDFIEKNHRAVLITRRSDGGIQSSPITVALDAQGRAVISSTEDRVKVRNLRHDPRATMTVVNDKWYGSWVQIDGLAEIVSLPEAMELLVDYYRRVSGEHPDWEDYRAAMERDRRVLVRVTIERAGGVLTR